MNPILIVEDDININNLVKKNLELVGYVCEQAYAGDEVFEKLEHGIYDLLILDVNLPGFSGFEIMESIRDIPVILLTARDRLTDRLKGFELGAEDYITKPFEILELVARVNVVLRRKKPNRMEYKDILVDTDKQIIYKNNEVMEMSVKEYRLFVMLLENVNLTLSRDRIIERIWSDDFDGDYRTVDNHISKLRRKLGLDAEIRSIYKMGYRLDL